MTEMKKAVTIHGHQIELPEGRKVWAGEHDDSWYIQFVSKEGDVRKLRISYEAADALVKLITAKPETILRYVLTFMDGHEMKWEQFEPDLAAVTSQMQGGTHD